MAHPVSPPVACCHELRCKSLFYRSDERPGWLHASDTMTYWCAVTLTDEGPDGEPVEHARCSGDRPCRPDAEVVG